jgi:hypothetical protein
MRRQVSSILNIEYDKSNIVGVYYVNADKGKMFFCVRKTLLAETRLSIYNVSS